MGGRARPTSRIPTPTTPASTGRCSGSPATGEDEEFSAAAIRNLDWVLSTQQENGWFEWCNFRPGDLPNSHGIAYTMRGLLESAVLLGDERYLESALRTAHALLGVYRRLGAAARTYERDWTPRANWVCVTGLAQTGGVWLRLYQETGDAVLRRAGLEAVEQAPRLQSAPLARHERRRAGLLPDLRPVRAAPVPELGGEVPRRLARAAAPSHRQWR